MRRLLAAMLAVIALAAHAGPGQPATAQEAPLTSPISVRVAFDPPTVALGERTRLTVTVTHSDDLLISASEPRRSEALRLLDAPPPVSTPAGDGELVTVFSYLLAGFALGELTPGALRVSWLHADGAAGSIEVAAPPLIVRSTLTAGDTELRPLKPQIGIEGAPPAWRRPASVAALAVVLLSAGVAAWVVRVRRRRAPPEAIEAAPSGPEVAARRRLDRLASARALENGDFDGYYGTISTVVRGFLEERFEFRATALTTVELQSRMVARGVDRWQARLVGGLLDRCDAAVYAHRYPDPLSADHDLTVAYEIVELSRPPSLVSPA